MQPHEVINDRIEACFVDIDATITDDGDVRQIGPGHPFGNALFGVLRDAMVHDGWDREQAVEALAAHANDVVFWDYQDFIGEFNLPVKHAWDRIIQWHDTHLVVHDDAVAMVKRLHAADLPLYIISNNPTLGCLLKLQRAGLGTLQGTPWFKDILGANTLRGQKSSIGFWERAVTHTGLAPRGIVVIGDDPEQDFHVPRQVGVRHFFLVDRTRTETAVYENGAWLVNNLEWVADRLTTLAQTQRDNE